MTCSIGLVGRLIASSRNCMFVDRPEIRLPRLSAVISISVIRTSMIKPNTSAAPRCFYCLNGSWRDSPARDIGQAHRRHVDVALGSMIERSHPVAPARVCSGVGVPLGFVATAHEVVEFHGRYVRRVAPPARCGCRAARRRNRHRLRRRRGWSRRRARSPGAPRNNGRSRSLRGAATSLAGGCRCRRLLPGAEENLATPSIVPPFRPVQKIHHHHQESNCERRGRGNSVAMGRGIIQDVQSDTRQEPALVSERRAVALVCIPAKSARVRPTARKGWALRTRVRWQHCVDWK